MKTVAAMLAFAVMISLAGCHAMFADKWDSWIGHDWHEFNDAGGGYSGHCYQSSPNRVTCGSGPSALITMGRLRGGNDGAIVGGRDGEPSSSSFGLQLEQIA